DDRRSDLEFARQILEVVRVIQRPLVAVVEINLKGAGRLTVFDSCSPAVGDVVVTGFPIQSANQTVGPRSRTEPRADAAAAEIAATQEADIRAELVTDQQMVE